MEAYTLVIFILGAVVTIGYSNPVQPNPFQRNALRPDYSGIPQCMQPSESGMCLAYFPSWYFNPTKKTCEEFIYGGCGGNDNRFITFDQCMDTCGKFEVTTTDFKLKEEDSEEVTDFCKLSAETGPCRAMMPRFYFNGEENKCEQFMWGGCEGNKNNFVSVEACQAKCGPNSNEESEETPEVKPEVKPEGESVDESHSNESSEEAAKNE